MQVAHRHMNYSNPTGRIMRPTGYEKLPYEKQFQSGQKFWKNVGQLWCDLQKSLGESLEIFGKWSEIFGNGRQCLGDLQAF